MMPTPARVNNSWHAISHDMKTPLSAIQLYNSLLQDMPPHDPSRALFHHMINDQVMRLVVLTENPPVPSTTPQTDLRMLLADLVRLYHRLHAERGYAFVLDMQTSPASLPVSEHVMARVFDNLLDNAVKYSTPHTVHICVWSTGRFVAVDVRDKGCGIRECDRERLFDPYYRAGWEGSVSGTGLGLAIVRDIVEIHGGQVEISSTEGEGSTFRVLFPVKGSDHDDAKGE